MIAHSLDLGLRLELAVARDLARMAGAALLRHRAGPLEVGYKARGEIVTAADRESDRIIRDGLAVAFPGDAVYSEETPDTGRRLSMSRVWIVDPLDSTSNYAAGGDEYCVSIGLALNGRPVLGAVYSPARNEMIAGAHALGVTLNDRPVRVSEVQDLATARLTVSRKEWQLGLADLCGGLSIRPRASLAAKLARVAAGLDDGVFTAIPRKEWGTCAGVALVLAAGGHATLLDGSPIRFNRPELKQVMGMLAAGPELHRPLLRWLQDGLPGRPVNTNLIHPTERTLSA
jgi:fructose-1,6-bisphosphatase/inositol monophosphatase family enzyme